MPSEHSEIQSAIEVVISRHDLLQHPFYQAWTSGKLDRSDLQRYAEEYYHHVAAFPCYLSALHSRLPDGTLRRAVLRNLCEEEITGTAHSELWLDFAEGVGAAREATRQAEPSAATRQLMDTFQTLATERSPLAAMGAFYAYESQVARIATPKAQGLRKWYGASPKTYTYFAQHSTQDVHHAKVWLDWVERGVAGGDASLEEVLAAVDQAATALWKSLDGIYEGNQTATAACNAN